MLGLIHITPSFVTVFLYMFLYKVGFIDYVKIKGLKVFSKLADCLFCTCFWLTVIVHMYYFKFYDHFEIMIMSLLVNTVVALFIFKIINR